MADRSATKAWTRRRGPVAYLLRLIVVVYLFFLVAWPVYLVAQNTSRLLMAAGDLVTAWLLVRQSEVALAALAGEVSAKDRSFYEGKLAATRFFCTQVLPKLTAERAIVEATDNSLMDLDEAVF